jgi:hypothetical protein
MRMKAYRKPSRPQDVPGVGSAMVSLRMTPETAPRRVMLDPQTRQQLQTKFQQIKPQLKGQFSGLSDQDWDAAQRDPDMLIETISRKTGQGREQVEQTVRQLVSSTNY